MSELNGGCSAVEGELAGSEQRAVSHWDGGLRGERSVWRSGLRLWE